MNERNFNFLDSSVGISVTVHSTQLSCCWLEVLVNGEVIDLQTAVSFSAFLLASLDQLKCFRGESAHVDGRHLKIATKRSKQQQKAFNIRLQFCAAQQWLSECLCLYIAHSDCFPASWTSLFKKGILEALRDAHQLAEMPTTYKNISLFRAQILSSIEGIAKELCIEQSSQAALKALFEVEPGERDGFEDLLAETANSHPLISTTPANSPNFEAIL